MKTLDESLTEGVEKANLHMNDSTLDMMSAPVETSYKAISTVTNNGHAMAPYMMSVALYVAALAFTLMYPIRKDIEKTMCIASDCVVEMILKDTMTVEKEPERISRWITAAKKIAEKGYS